MKALASLLSLALCIAPVLADDDEETEDKLFASKNLSALKFRPIGPAITEGRISDIAIVPGAHHHWYAATASGGVWETVNSGTTWKPIFEGKGSYSIGCITIDPGNPLVLWVGTGENNSQRSVSYGDGVYKSVDGGTSWENVGLEDSEHIAKIVVDPRDSDHVYVAAQGPLWREGGDRGLYETADGGDTWNLILEVDEHTGVTDLVIDPRDPDVMYAATYQRRRHVWTLIDGGPGSGIWKSTDGGATWEELKSGLPKSDMGRIGLALSANPDIVYAIIEAAEDGGFYASTDRGASWKKRSKYVSGSPQYYQELVTDPVDPDRVYSNDTWLQVSDDGGRNFDRIGQDHKHVDNHALWIDPANTDHLVAGCDGGVYETWDREHWRFGANLPLVQFYKIAVDQDFPFYNVYGGTQDNNTLGGPSRTVSANGIANRDWFITLGGDGFKPQIDPENPDIVYSQYQYGGLARFDRQSGEILDIQPQPTDETGPLKWNWSSALLISPHSSTRLYYGSQYLFQSDDRGDSWRPISPDLTRQIDRNTLEIMGRVWSVDAVAKNRSTSFYGTIVSVAESALQEGLIYAGTDDGLIQVTEDGGATWKKHDTFAETPDMSYVSSIAASLHDADTVYATLDNHKKGDFTPYVVKSTNRGKSWKSIAGDLPERGQSHVIVEDHGNPDLLFVGTEFGVFFTRDGGAAWVQLKSGLPVVACRDLEIQRRENDLVVGTFGRGIYVLDDYSPLRSIDEEAFEAESILFSPRRTWMFMQSSALGLPGKSFMGDNYFTLPNPDVGAVLTYYLKETIETRKKQRQESEKEAREKGDPNPYPPWEELRREDREEKPEIVLTVRDAEGNVVRRLSAPAKSGTHRITWNLRYAPPNPTSLKKRDTSNPFQQPPMGPMVVPGVYTVTMAQRVDGELTALPGEVSFEAIPLATATLPATDRQQLVSFQRRTADLQRAVLGARRLLSETTDRVDHLKKATFDTAADTVQLQARLREVAERLQNLGVKLNGDRTLRRRAEPTMPSIRQRLSQVVEGHWTSSSGPTTTHRDNYDIAAREFGPVLEELQRIVETDLPAIENEAERLGAPWTPGRVPGWDG